MTPCYRPIPFQGLARPGTAVPLAGGPLFFDRAERLLPDGSRELVPVSEIPSDLLERLTAPRAPLARIDWAQPRIMGILNVTPDSFSDGGRHNDLPRAVDHARAMQVAGADMLDIGGESTRPGADPVDEAEEEARTAPVIAAIRAETDVPISIDTRRAGPGVAAMAAGADLINDVAALLDDAALEEAVVANRWPVSLMHMKGTPQTMQKDPRYDHVVLEVFAHLEARIAALEAKGLPCACIMVDPGIGFAKTVDHNLALLRDISVFHGLGCPILLGVSRKRFIGDIGQAAEARARFPGSMAVALAALGQGVQMLRVHDVAETAQAVRLWQKVTFGGA